jgi:hypothetical protein
LNEKAISPEDAELLLRKLLQESIPVVALLFCPDGAHSKIRGLITSITATGFVISTQEDFPSLIAVPVPQPDGTGCEFIFGDTHGLPNGLAKKYVTKEYGATTLTIVLPSGSRLILSFNA